MGVPSNIDSSISDAQKILRRRLCGQSLPHTIHGYEKERRHLHDVLQRTAEFGESNSVLLVGPRGCGKSMLLESVLSEIKKSKEVETNLMEVRLNGLMQTDDRIALKEIAKQLQLENVIGDKVFGSFAETLQFLLDALKSGGQNTKPVLFVLDEFDLFAQHKNQTLLYNLFDVSQSAQTPVCVIGLTCRLDVVELLEKRVKSRFSHRQIHLFCNLSFEEYVEVFSSSLTLHDDFPHKTYLKEWNANIKKLSTEPAVIDVLRKQYMMNKDIRALHKLLFLPVCQVSVQHPQLKAADIVNSSRSLAHDSKAVMLQGLSILELCLIIAMKQMMETYEGEPFNFEMVFSAYLKFAQRQSSLQMFDKAVVLKAFEHLCALELVRPVDGSSGRIQKEYRLMTLLVDPTQVSEALLKYHNCPTDIKQWASHTIHA